MPFQFRTEQMEALTKHRVDVFVERMIVHLQSEFADEIRSLSIASDELDKFVREGIDMAESYEVVNEDDVELFLECRLMFGPSFDRDLRVKWASETLNRADLNGTEKMDIIHDYVIFATDKAQQ